jgi:hypothetical protein
MMIHVRMGLQISNEVAVAALFILMLAIYISPAMSQGQTTTSTAPSQTCISSDPNAVWDTASSPPDCNFVCKPGYHFDSNGKCVSDAASPEEIESAAIQDLSSSDDNTVINAVVYLEKIRSTKAIIPLADTLAHHKNPNVRLNAAFTLGKIGNTQSVTPLINVLRNDTDPRVRNEAAIALGEIGSTQVVSQAIMPLIDATNDSVVDVRFNAVLALGILGSTQAVSPLINVLKNDEDPRVRAVTALALGEIGDPTAIGPLQEAVNDPSDLVRSRAQDALNKLQKAQNNSAVCGPVDYSKLRKVDTGTEVYYFDANNTFQGIYKQYWNADKKQLYSEGCYLNGKKNGLWTYWYMNGQKRSEGEFKDDLLNGSVVDYDMKGNKVDKVVYENGHLVSRQNYINPG